MTSIDDAVREAEYLVREAERLTKRQREFLFLIAEGLPNSQIALRCGVTEGTVGNTISNIAEFLDVRGRQLSVVAVRYRMEVENSTYKPPFTISEPDLTPLQAEIVSLAGVGLTNDEIADQLDLKVRTVSAHINGIKKALPPEISSSRFRSFWAYAAWYATRYAARPSAEHAEHAEQYGAVPKTA